MHDSLNRGWILGQEAANIRKGTLYQCLRVAQKQLTYLPTGAFHICTISISVCTNGRGPALKLLVFV